MWPSSSLPPIARRQAEDMAELADCMDESWLYAFYGSWR